MFNKIREIIFHHDKQVREKRWIFSTLLIAAILSLIAAFTLSVEAIELAKNPDAQFDCSINIVINCATVAKTPYASMFGFPNAFIGLMAEPVFILVAILGLMGAKLSRQFMFGIQLFAIFSTIFAYYLLFVSTFVIQTICPWCMLVMGSTTLMLFVLTRYNIRHENLYLNKNQSAVAKNFIDKDYDKLLFASLMVAIAAMIILKHGEGLFA